MRWRGMDFADVTAQMTNKAGLLEIIQLQGKLNQGVVSLPGTLDATASHPRIVFHPRLENVEIGTILNAFNYPISLTGKMSLAGISLVLILMLTHSATPGRGRRMSKWPIRAWKA